MDTAKPLNLSAGAVLSDGGWWPNTQDKVMDVDDDDSSWMMLWLVWLMADGLGFDIRFLG